MIKNVVFDFGQVLVKFDPSYMVGRYVSDLDDARLLEEVLFDRLYWDRLDAGTITDEDVIAACKERVPSRLWAILPEIYYNWIYNIPEIEGMAELLRHLRKSYGVRLFLLSNISLYFAAHADEIPVLRLVDKCVFSAVCGHVKPRREIFEHLCTECGIVPEQTVFVDDNAANVSGAREYGITGYLFDGDSKGLQKYLDTLLNAETQAQQ